MRLATSHACCILLLCVSAQHYAHANETSIIVPNSLADQEGDQSATFDTDFTNGLHIQVVYPAAQFDALPDGGAWLTEIRFRPDRFVTAPRMQSFDRWYFRASTTDKTPDTISLSFSENIGPDETVVYDGPITLSTTAGGPPMGPRPFDYIIKLETPFFYDPAKGNLLTDNTQSPGRWIRPDGDVGVLGKRSVVSFNTIATAGELFSTSVAEFIFVPEPSASILATMSFFTFLGFVRHSRV